MRACEHAGVRSSTEESERTCRAGTLPMQAQSFSSSQAVRFQIHSALFYTWIVVAHVRAKTIRPHQTTGHRARPQQSFRPRSQHHTRFASRSKSSINYFYSALRVCYCFLRTSGSLEGLAGCRHSRALPRCRQWATSSRKARGRRRLPSRALRGQQGALHAMQS